MRINLDYYIFTEDPYEAFGERYDLPRAFWVEIYHNRYLWRGYSIAELSEICKILSVKYKSPLSVSEKTIRRWISRTEIYNKAQKIIAKGVQEVDTEYFDKLADYIIHNYKINGTTK